MASEISPNIQSLLYIHMHICGYGAAVVYVTTDAKHSGGLFPARAAGVHTVHTHSSHTATIAGENEYENTK